MGQLLVGKIFLKTGREGGLTSHFLGFSQSFVKKTVMNSYPSLGNLRNGGNKQGAGNFLTSIPWGGWEKLGIVNFELGLDNLSIFFFKN